MQDVIIILIRHVYTHWIWHHWNTVFFFWMNQDVLYNLAMAGCACTKGGINAMPTVLERDNFGGLGSVMIWAATSH